MVCSDGGALAPAVALALSVEQCVRQHQIKPYKILTPNQAQIYLFTTHKLGWMRQTTPNQTTQDHTTTPNYCIEILADLCLFSPEDLLDEGVAKPAPFLFLRRRKNYKSMETVETLKTFLRHHPKWEWGRTCQTFGSKLAKFSPVKSSKHFHQFVPN